MNSPDQQVLHSTRPGQLAVHVNARVATRRNCCASARTSADLVSRDRPGYLGASAPGSLAGVWNAAGVRARVALVVGDCRLGLRGRPPGAVCRAAELGRLGRSRRYWRFSAPDERAQPVNCGEASSSHRYQPRAVSMLGRRARRFQNPSMQPPPPHRRVVAALTPATLAAVDRTRPSECRAPTARRFARRFASRSSRAGIYGEELGNDNAIDCRPLVFSGDAVLGRAAFSETRKAEMTSGTANRRGSRAAGTIRSTSRANSGRQARRRC
jgi:hypothetical protein